MFSYSLDTLCLRVYRNGFGALRFQNLACILSVLFLYSLCFQFPSCGGVPERRGGLFQEFEISGILSRPPLPAGTPPTEENFFIPFIRGTVANVCVCIATQHPNERDKHQKNRMKFQAVGGSEQFNAKLCAYSIYFAALQPNLVGVLTSSWTRIETGSDTPSAKLLPTELF